MNRTDRPVIVALDFDTLDGALALADRLDPATCRVKVGKELFTRAGPAAVRALGTRGFEVFLDLKFHDIPNTVAGACRAAADLGCWMVNVHAGGGRAMMTAAAAALAGQAGRPLLIAVTVLTSLDDLALGEVGVDATAGDQVVRLATLAESCGLDGVVCSPLEIAPLRGCLDPGFTLVTPGVRPAGAAQDDQVRIATPGSAIAAGASYLVVGRPVTRAADPAAAVLAIDAECREARRA
ncbi:MAG: orotidine-5'-phosphate decarboxylase [Gammaproteobacteria bacterium]|nr:orotidine-5'-phosphate decarboxylase [Gammaproteobacteria bacterium]MCP5201593.1 orotidine-5'-phosphate decarboxylase [Gammaproteobacteria bacterium]